MRPNDTVQCLYPHGYPLTAGKTYTVLSAEGDWVIVTDDTGNAGRYPAVRFTPMEASAPGPTAASPPPPDLPSLSILRSPSQAAPSSIRRQST